jgi:phosphoglycolate phosphatase
LGKYKTVLFDLDGTLTDPKEGITKSIQYALSNMNIIETDLDALESFIGPPLHATFKEMYGFNAQQIELAIHSYRERFQEKGMFENFVYPGIPELLNELRLRGYKLAIATSKPTLFAMAILEHFGLDHYFDTIVGSNLDGTRSAKGEVIAEVLRQLCIENREGCIMVGDRLHDVLGAAHHHIDTIGVTYGYGTRKELETAGAVMIAASVEDLKNALMSEHTYSLQP